MTTSQFRIVQQAVKRNKAYTTAFVLIDKPKNTTKEQQHLEEVLKNL